MQSTGCGVNGPLVFIFELCAYLTALWSTVNIIQAPITPLLKQNKSYECNIFLKDMVD